MGLGSHAGYSVAEPQLPWGIIICQRGWILTLTTRSGSQIQGRQGMQGPGEILVELHIKPFTLRRTPPAPRAEHGQAGQFPASQGSGPATRAVSLEL